MFWQDLDPGYYQNPAAYTYLVYGDAAGALRPARLPVRPALRQRHRAVRQGPRRALGRGAHAGGGARAWPGVAATYAAARRLWGVREGLVAAAVLAFAFLPVAYSRVAVTDVGALAGVALALMWSVRAAEDGPHARLRAGRRGRRPGDRVQVHGGPGAAAARRSPRSARLRADGAAAGRRARARRAGGRGVVFALLNPYVFGSLGRLVDATCATRPTSPPATPSRARSRAASPTTSTASPGASAGPGSRRRWRARCWCCGATWCAA